MWIKTVTNSFIAVIILSKLLSIVNIPEEYLRIECNYFFKEKQKLTKNNYRIVVVNMEEVELNLDEVVSELKERNDTLFVRNEMAYIWMQFLNYGLKTL